MKFFKKTFPKNAIVVVLFFMALILGVVIFFTRSSPEFNLQNVHIIEAEIIKVGAEQAYANLKDNISSKSITDQHIDAHYFGEALYNVTGVEGIKICDDSLFYGCYHAFIGVAIKDKGVGVAKELNQACNNKAGCRHGIGHGLVAYMGYEDGVLEKVLSICDEFDDDQYYFPRNGCSSGVFMEYNRRTMINPHGGKEVYRELTDDFYYPCSFLPDKYRIDCFDEQVHWWVIMFDRDYKRVGDLCLGIQNEHATESCISSLGTSLPLRVNSVEKIIDVCELMPNIDLNISCRAAAALKMETLGQRNDGICSGITQEESRKCFEKKDTYEAEIFKYKGRS